MMRFRILLTLSVFWGTPKALCQPPTLHKVLNLQTSIRHTLETCKSEVVVHNASDVGAIRRRVASGDPQTTAQRFFQVLYDNGIVLGPDGKLPPHVQLVIAGDYFDPSKIEGPRAWKGMQGVEILSWARSHPERNIVLVFGNHEFIRVTEMIGFDDKGIGEATLFARSIDAYEKNFGSDATAEKLRRAFAARYPALSSHDVLTLKYPTYSDAQKRLVMQTLLMGRFVLAHPVTLPTGESAKMTHSMFATSDVRHLGLLGSESPSVIAEAFNRFLMERVDRVRPHWERFLERGGTPPPPLDLDPIARPGNLADNARGILVQRPSNLDNAAGMRLHGPLVRVDPRRMIAGVSIGGHSGHHGSMREQEGGGFGAWIKRGAGDMKKNPGLRLLSVFPNGEIVYEPYKGQPIDENAVSALLMIDATMDHPDYWRDHYPPWETKPRVPLLELKPD